MRDPDGWWRGERRLALGGSLALGAFALVAAATASWLDGFGMMGIGFGVLVLTLLLPLGGATLLLLAAGLREAAEMRHDVSEDR